MRSKGNTFLPKLPDVGNYLIPAKLMSVAKGQKAKCCSKLKFLYRSAN